VVLLAPATAASRVRGAQLRLAEAAGSGGELFLPSALDAKVWWSRSLSATGGGALRLREVYAGAEAARALVCGAGADARMLVLADGPLADGWGAVMDALPEGAERISRREPMDVGWQALDFAARVARARLVDDFLLRHRPAPRPVRRVLILHAPADQALAERLADVLAEAAGKRDADVVATLFEPSTTASRALAWSSGTWVTLLALLSRFTQRGELGRLGQLAWWFVPRLAADARGMRIDLVVIESEWDEAGVPAARGLERVADSVISLKPAIERRDRPGLYPPEAYDQVIHLPAPSALTQSLGALARRLLAEPEGIDALGASPSSAEPGLKTRR
jgi:hypothetical protein